MTQDTARKIITRFSIGWGLLALILVGLVLGKIIDLDLFQWVFAGGFALWVVLVTALSRFTLE